MFKGLILGLLLAATAANAQGVDHDATNHTDIQNNLPKPTSDAQSVPFTSVQNQIERVARALEAANNRRPATDEQDRAERSLKAQEDTAKWAFWMLFVAGAETLVTLFGVFLVYRTLIHTRDAAIAARDAVTEAKEATKIANSTLAHAEEQTKRELRAYLSVEPAGINQLINTLDGMGHITVRNVGKVPAHNVFVRVHMREASAKNPTFSPYDHDQKLVERAIQPGAYMKQGSIERLPLSELCISGRHIFVWGAVYYDDGFGKRRFTHFCHRYAADSYNRDGNWARFAIETKHFIDSDKARYHTDGNDSD